MERIDLEGILDKHRARLDDLNEHRRLSADPADYRDVLEAAKEMMDGCLSAIFRQLGEAPPVDRSGLGLVKNAAALLTRRPDALRNPADLRWAVGLLERQEQNLRDINYLQRGFGRGSGKPKPHDMRWDHPSSVVGDVRDSFARLFDAFTDPSAVRRLPGTAVEIDLGTVREGIEKLLRSGLAPKEYMGGVIDLCREQATVPAWDAFRDLPFEHDLDDRSSVVVDITTREPPSAPIAAFYFIIGYPSREGETVADLWTMGSDRYHRDDEHWLDAMSYVPADGWVRSNALASIYRLAYSPGGPGNAADYALCLSWAAYLSRACVEHYLASTNTDRVALVVGFSDGDSIDLGWVSRP